MVRRSAEQRAALPLMEDHCEEMAGNAAKKRDALTKKRTAASCVTSGSEVGPMEERTAGRLSQAEREMIRADGAAAAAKDDCIIVESCVASIAELTLLTVGAPDWVSKLRDIGAAAGHAVCSAGAAGDDA